MAEPPKPRDEAVTFALTVNSLQRALPEYRILRELGSGAMGTVFEAEDPRLERRVAIKVLQPSATRNSHRELRFQREVAAIARLSHPNIVPIHAVGEAAELHYFVMGFIAGAPLSEAIRADGFFPYRRAFRLIRQAVSALAQAHHHGIIHRDIKPANLLLQQDDRVILTDFGLARSQDSRTMTETGAIVGTPMYMAPEQILGEKDKIDARCDLYAVGATLYQMLTGCMPFHGETTSAVLRSVLDRPPVPFSKAGRAGRQVPRDAQKIVLKLLHKKPSDRYSSAEELLADIDRLLAGKPVEASLPGMLSRVGRSIARHPLPSAIVAVIALVAIVSISSLKRQNIAERRINARSRAEIRDLGRAKELRGLESRLRETIMRVGPLWTRQGQLDQAIGDLEGILASDQGKALLDPRLVLAADEEAIRRRIATLAHPFLAALHFYRGLTCSGLDEIELDLKISLRLCEQGLQLDPSLLGLKLQRSRVLVQLATFKDPLEILKILARLDEVSRYSAEERATKRYQAFHDFELKTLLAQVAVRRLEPVRSVPATRAADRARRREALAEIEKILAATAGLEPGHADPYLLRERARAFFMRHELRGGSVEDEDLRRASMLINFVRDVLPSDPHSQFLLAQIIQAQGRNLIEYIKVGEEAIRLLTEKMSSSGSSFLRDAFPFLSSENAKSKAGPDPGDSDGQDQR